MSIAGHRIRRSRIPQPPPPPPPSEETFNIIPTHILREEHPLLDHTEAIRATTATIRAMGGLRNPPSKEWRNNMDLLDWLGFFFGFQKDNVKNQREHLILHLANSQMRLNKHLRNSINALDHLSVLRKFREELLQNYTSWCNYLGKQSSVRLSIHRHVVGGVGIGIRFGFGVGVGDVTHHHLRRELLYVSLYLLIWGESANLRFVPECICYIFHHMAMELNRILDDNMGDSLPPSTCDEYGFLRFVVRPLYQAIQVVQVESSQNGTVPLNYDDINEYFWNEQCFKTIKWPIRDEGSKFFVKNERVGKMGFVEKRSFWNLFRSFDRLWVVLILILQASVIVAWEEKDYPWEALVNRRVQVKLLTVFITWSGLRLLQAVLDALMQRSLISRERIWLGVRMVLKILVATTWTVVFAVLYWKKIWCEKNLDRILSGEANYLSILALVSPAALFIFPELLALILYISPSCIRNFIEKSNWRVLNFLTWWFNSRIFVGRGLNEWLANNFTQKLFWLVVLASKFSFSYLLQIKPMVAPTKARLNLQSINHFNWHEFLNYVSGVIIVLVLRTPVVLIYLMDLQIWYSIFSSIVGATFGLFSHLGTNRNIQQLRLRFRFFANTMLFNLMPKINLSANVTLMKKLVVQIQRLKIRCGLSWPKENIESSKADSIRFGLIWNEIIITLREEDLISDRELELLELPLYCCDDVNGVICWPFFLLCNELRLALSHAVELENATDRLLWLKICKNEYRRCSVIEAYESIKHLLLENIVRHGTEENSIVANLFTQIDDYIRIGKFTEAYKMTVLPQIHAKLVSLLELLMKPEKDMYEVVKVFQDLYEVSVREFPKANKSIEELRQEGLAPQSQTSNRGLTFLFENALKFPGDESGIFYRCLQRLHRILSWGDSMQNFPKNVEARRRITFFSNSFFMNMPCSPPTDKMLAFTILTPYYEDQEVIYGKEMLEEENEDGISPISYLQKIYKDEWENFIERMQREGKEDMEMDIRLWASYRGQTLSRTVRGMMYYNRALMMLSFLDSASDNDIIRVSQQLFSHGYNSMKKLQLIGASLEHSEKALMKFSFVLACEDYGRRHKATDILYLMKHNEALRVAYVDKVDNVYDSVLVKYDQQLEKVVEIYRIRLPVPLKLGEGKSENQNHALIFTRGDALVPIDMNQDNYFEEALKMRNLLEEFKANHGCCSRKSINILGIRENVFTDSVSSLGRFMSGSVTPLGQRLLANTLKVQMHHGQTVVFDRFWFLTRGGISKASRTINISSDIFASFNCTLRGGTMKHLDYIQVGKGRDVGFNQISKFKAKVACGNAEQILSRDVYRLGHRLDFFSMLSFFYSSVGFPFNTLLVVLTIYTFLWGHFYLALWGIQGETMDSANNNTALGTILKQQFMFALGLFTVLPMIVEKSLEHGFLPTVWDLLTMQLQLAPLFSTFSMVTRSHFFSRTILYGGTTKHQATGRHGFLLQHKSFVENYRLYARSHFLKANELGLFMILFAFHSPIPKNTLVYVSLTILSWSLVVSSIMAPFVFNPSGFDWLKTVDGFNEFKKWIRYEDRNWVFTKPEKSWEAWWYEEQDHLRTTGFGGKLFNIISVLRFFLLHYRIIKLWNIANGNTSIDLYLLSWIYPIVAIVSYVIMEYARKKEYDAKKHVYYRTIQLLVIVLFVLVPLLVLKFTQFKFLDFVISLLAFIPAGWGLISVAQILRACLKFTEFCGTIVFFARLYDMLFGMIVMAPVALLSWFPGFDLMQTRILFNGAFSRDLRRTSYYHYMAKKPIQ